MLTLLCPKLCGFSQAEWRVGCYRKHAFPRSCPVPTAQMADLLSLLLTAPFFPTQDCDPLWLCMTQCNRSNHRLEEFSNVPKERGTGSAELGGCLEDCLHTKKGYDLMRGRYSSLYKKHLCPKNRILNFAPFCMVRITVQQSKWGKLHGESRQERISRSCNSSGAKTSLFLLCVHVWIILSNYQLMFWKYMCLFIVS